MSILNNFDYVSRGHGSCWKHKTKPCWIVFYNTTYMPPFYEAYRIKPYITQKKGQEPWACDNVRLSDGDGFTSFEDAAKAIEVTP